MRQDARCRFIALLLCIWPFAASADDGGVAKLVSECSDADLPKASLDSCLERVRVLEETDPSPQLQTLEASLEQRSAPPAPTRATAATAPRVVEVAPDPVKAAEEESSRDRSTEQTTQSESSGGRSGVALEDEPPVSDAPDLPERTDPADDDTNDPPQT